MKLKKLWIVILVLCLPVPAFSAGNLHFGALEIHPFIGVTETYNDNIFARPDNTVHDWITTITPGIKLALPVRNHLFTADYKAVIDRYASNDSENTTDHYANAMADLKFGSLFGLKVSDNYVHGHEARYDSATGLIEKYDKNKALIGGTYQLADRSKVELDYSRTWWDFQTSEFRSRHEDLLSAYLYYRFLPKTSAFIEYDWRNVIYDEKTNGLDNTVHTPFLGLTWEMSTRTKGTVKAGYLQKNFEAGDKNDISTWGASVDVDHAFTDYASIKVVALRDVNESNAEGSTYYVTTGGFVEYTHKLTYKISALARVAYGVDDYTGVIVGDTTDRSDKTFLGGVGLKYQMRDWLEFALDYYYRYRDSNIDIYDLRMNTYALTVNFAL